MTISEHLLAIAVESEWDEWDDYEEDGPQDLEDQLDVAFRRAAALAEKDHPNG